MNLEKINWKLYFEKPDAARPEVFFKVLGTWIPESPEVFVDVADYEHVHDGPLTILVGHYVDYTLDHADRRLGFLYSRKRGSRGTNAERLRASLKEFLKTAQRLESAPEFGGQLKLSTKEFQFILNDRGIATNTKEDFEKVRPELSGLFSSLFGDNAFSLNHSPHPKKRLSVSIKPKQEKSVKDLLAVLEK